MFRAPSRLLDLLWSTTGRRRGHAKLTLLALGVYALFAVVVAVEVRLGMMEAGPAFWFCVVSLGGILVFYALVRSGLSERLSHDPSLTMSQSVFGISVTAWGYAINPQLRGAVMAIMLLNLVWGMFVMSPREARLLGAQALAMLGGVMLWKARTDPARFPPHIEAIQFGFCLILMTAMSALAVSMGRLRAKLRQRQAELQQALAKIHHLATRDDLTGLVNRRHLTELLDAERVRQKHHGLPLSLVLMDLDHFKPINDNHGHAAGDRVLKIFADAAQAALRDTDVLGRWGGEEFLLMLPATPQAQALQCVDRLRAGLAAAPFDAVAPGLRLTFSAGLSTCADGEALQAAIERADKAMYQAKLSGRDSTVVG
jgi:diguanylate cyclase